MDITNKMAIYIKTNKISLIRINKDTNIPMKKLTATNKLLATEFLKLCQYLNINPEDF